MGTDPYHFDYSDMSDFQPMRTVRRNPAMEEQVRMDALEAELEATGADFEGYDEDADEMGKIYAAIEERQNDIQGKLDALSRLLEEPYPDDLEIAGAIVTIDHAGRLRIERGLIRKEDMKKLPPEESMGIAAGKGNGTKPCEQAS